MSIQFSGLGSGLPVSDWINAIIQSESVRLQAYQEDKSDMQMARTSLNTIESKFSLLRSSTESLTDANLASTLDLFIKKKSTSSDEDIATANVSTKASIQNIKLQVESLATATTAQSITDVGQTIVGTDVFADLANAKVNEEDSDATDGTFSFYANGQKTEITISETDTLDDIAGKINAAGVAGVQAQVANGKFEFQVDEDIVTNGFILGSTADTSNFLDSMHLSTAKREDRIDGSFDAVYASVDAVSKVNYSGNILDGSANLAGTFGQSEYTFKIGGSEFTVDENTAFSDLISKINSDEDAGVIASYNARDNKLIITSETEGANAISFEDTDGDFLQQMGLITAIGDSISSQTLGNNAKVYLNGSTEAIEVNSNKLTGEISGITGVNITLKDTTEAGEEITINVEQDTDSLTNAMQGVVDKINGIISEIDKKTKYGEELSGEYQLVTLRNNLRMMATDQVQGLSTYDSFAMIGITTGDVGTSVDEDTTALKFDKDAFLEAFLDNPEEVKAMLVGDADRGITGVLQSLEEEVESILDITNGYFAAREDSFNRTIASLDDTILREQERLDAREASLTAQFNAMDRQISQMQSQSSAIGML